MIYISSGVAAFIIAGILNIPVTGVAAFIIAGILDIPVTGVAAFNIAGDIWLSSR